MLRWAFGLLLTVASVTGLILGALNPESATLDLGFFQLTLSLGAMVALAVGLGILIGLVSAPLLCSGGSSKNNAGQARAAVVSDQHRSLNG